MHEPRHDWTLAEAEQLFALPFPDLLFQAQQVHRAWHDPSEVQMSTLLSIKTGACPEDCAYCPQSVRFDTGVANEALLPLEAVVERARAAREAGATRFCMGAAWRSPKAKDLKKVAAMVREVSALGLETCVTLGMVSGEQAPGLKEAGRERMSTELQALALRAGANSIFYGEKLLTTGNPDVARDRALLARLGIRPERPAAERSAAERQAATPRAALG